MVNLPTRIPDCDSHSPALLDFFLSSDASICSTMTFSPLGNSDHVAVSVSIDFPTNSQQDAPFHRIGYDYSCADWDVLCDHLRDVPLEDSFKLRAFAAASEFCVWVQVRIDVYIPHKKYQVKPHSPPWFSAACAPAIVHRNHFFHFSREKSSDSMVKFRQASNHCKRVLEAAKLAYADCIPVVVLKNCELELSHIVAELFRKESCFPDCWKVSSVVPVFKNVGERSTVKNYRPVSLLSVVSKDIEKLVNNRIVDHLEKYGLFSDFQYGFRCSRSTADLLTVVSDRIARAFNRSGATRPVPLDMSKAFDRVWHAGLFHKLKSYEISGWIFGLISSFLSNRQLQVVLDGKCSQEYPVNAAPFLVLNFFYYTLMTFLMILSVILSSMLMILLPILSVIGHLICGNNLNWLLNLNLIYETRWVGVRNGLLISMLGKLSWFCLTSLITMVLMM